MEPVDPKQPYDPDNIFAKILRGEIPCQKVHEDEWAFAFHDIGPQAPVHILVIPKGEYVSLDDFTASASDAEIAGFYRAVGHVAREAGLVESGNRAITNTGPDAGQIVPHFHVHVCGGAPLGRMIPES
jgi:diadenosine tetraphosphate (Ap4A) HIT family hydrolase